MTKKPEFLSWDSQFFGRRIGRLYAEDPNQLENTLKSIDCKEYSLLYLYSHFPLSDSLIGSFSLIDVGGCILFGKTPSGTAFCSASLKQNISRYKHEQPNPDVLEIAFISGCLSRFNIDPWLPKSSFRDLYTMWINKSLRRESGCDIFTYKIENTIVGLITVEWHEARCNIELLGVLPSYQNRGIASDLIRYIENACIDRDISDIEVRTQLCNASARALYTKNLFVERDRSFLYHAHSLTASTKGFKAETSASDSG